MKRKKRAKVAIIYQIFAKYREPVIKLLSEDVSEYEFTYFSDRVNTIDSVKTVDSSKADMPIGEGGIRWHFVKNVNWIGPFLWQIGVLKLAMSKKFDAIIYLGNMYYISTWISCLIARFMGKRTLMWTHGFSRDERGFRGWLRKKFYQLADGVLLYNNRAKKIFIKKGFDPEKIYVVYNSLDYDTQISMRQSITDGDKQSCRQKLFKEPNLPIILFIGRLIRQKKLIMILDAAKILNEKGCRCNILFIGDGPERHTLEKATKQMELTDYICMYGECYNEKENAILISMSDICVSPGNIGLTCMHSLVYGTPVITHDDPNFQGPEFEAIEPGYNGDFFKKDNIEDLASTIENFLPKNKEIQLNCYRVIDDLYNPYVQVKIIKDAVKGCVPEDIHELCIAKLKH